MDALQTGKKFPNTTIWGPKLMFLGSRGTPFPRQVPKSLRCHQATPGCSICATQPVHGFCGWKAAWNLRMNQSHAIFKGQMSSAGAGKKRRERSNKGINFLMPWSCIFQWPSHASWNWVLLFGSLRAPKCPEVGKLAQKSLSWLKILSRFDSRRIKC